jgi:hypothetical protein
MLHQQLQFQCCRKFIQTCVSVYAEGLNAIEGFSVDVANVDTNMVRASLKPTIPRVK